MAKRFWVDADPVGRRFRYGVPGESPSAWRTVVGVVADTLPNGPESRFLPQFFLPQDQAPQAKSMDILVRSAQGRLPLANDLRAAVLSVSPQIPRFAVSTVDLQLDDSETAGVLSPGAERFLCYCLCSRGYWYLRADFLLGNRANS